MRLLITTSGIALLMVLVVSLGTKPVTMRITQNQAQAAGTATPTPTATATPTAIPTCGPSTYDIGNQFAAPAAACSPGAFLEGNGLDVCNKVNQYICATPVPSGGAPIFAHTLTGTTPTAVVNSSSSPAIDIQNETLAANVTSMTLPASSAVADGEIIEWIVQQSASGGPYQIPTYGATLTFSPLTAGSGTTLVARDGIYCGGFGMAQSSTAPSTLFMKVEYHAAQTQWMLTDCSGASVGTWFWEGSASSLAANTSGWISFGQQSDHATFTTEQPVWSIFPFPMTACKLSQLSFVMGTAPNGTNNPTVSVREEGDTCSGTSGLLTCTPTGTHVYCVNQTNYCFPGPVSVGTGQGLYLDVEVDNPAGANSTGAMTVGFMIQCPAT